MVQVPWTAPCQSVTRKGLCTLYLYTLACERLAVYTALLLLHTWPYGIFIHICSPALCLD
jgi:hypothetical protein